MWTSSELALETADRRLCELLGCKSLQEANHLYTGTPQPERWSDGLCKSVYDVTYLGWEPSALCRLILDRATGALGECSTFDLLEPPLDWHTHALKPVTQRAKLDWLRRSLQERLGRPAEVSGFVEYAAPGRRSLTVFEGIAWKRIESETILIRHNSETGDFMGWRHNGWFNRAPGPFPAIAVQELQSAVEKMPHFPRGLRFVDDWPSGDRRGHHELLWARYHRGEEVENDTLYASVNLIDRRVAECAINWSALEPELDLSLRAALAAFAKAFDEHFPGAVRCGTPVRKYIEIPDQSAKPRAWAASAIHDSGPVQVCIGNGGKVLRVDSTV